MKLLEFLVFLIPAAAVTLLQIRKLAKQGEVRTAGFYAVLMAIAVVMYGVVIFYPKLNINPMSLLLPFGYIGKYLFK